MCNCSYAFLFGELSMTHTIVKIAIFVATLHLSLCVGLNAHIHYCCGPLNVFCERSIPVMAGREQFSQCNIL